jgi:YD repeat-containing protein
MEETPKPQRVDVVHDDGTTESWTRDDAGRLLEHSLRRADKSLVYHEQWHRAPNGKLLFAESHSYDAAGNQTAHRKFEADAEGHIVRRDSWKTLAIRAVCLLVGGACLVVAQQQWHAANLPMAALCFGIACLNFWNGVKRR